MKHLNGRWATAAVAAVALATPSARAAGEIPITVTDAARAAVSAATGHFLKAKPQSNLAKGQDSTTLRIGGTARGQCGDDSDKSHNRPPGDLTYHGGAVVPSLVQHAIFVDSCTSDPSACWGDPLTFLHDYSKSEFVHVTDQYVGAHGHNRYPVGNNFVLNYAPPPTGPLTGFDMEVIAYLAAVSSGQSGYGHVFHIFLPPGQDICFDSTLTQCYSPDNFPTFFFCAYHGSFVADIGTVLYSVEPYQNVPGCAVRPGTPNGPVVDATDNVLSHETTETITDPDGTAWWNSKDNGLYGQEIADECSFITTTAFDPSDVVLNGRPYSIQPEYSNKGHICAVDGADDD